MRILIRSVGITVVDSDHFSRCPFIRSIDRYRNRKRIVRKGCKHSSGSRVANQPIDELLFPVRIKFKRLFDDALLGKMPHIGLRKPQTDRRGGCSQFHLDQC